MEETKFIQIEKQLIGTFWCIKCLPQKEYAEVLFYGESLCQKHLEKIKYGS
mgnify:CR=1 FL=1